LLQDRVRVEAVLMLLLVALRQQFEITRKVFGDDSPHHDLGTAGDRAHNVRLRRSD
jgi:hypothetical protein